MSANQPPQFLTLLQREFREYKTSLIWTPVVTALVLGVLMLGSVVLANRISVIGDTVLKVMMREGQSDVNLSISIGENGDQEIVLVERQNLDDALAPPEPPQSPTYRVLSESEVAEEQWNFSREWRFSPDMGSDPGDADSDSTDDEAMSGRELNVMLSVIHALLVLILLITSANYLLSSLFDDRKDRSILFWRSMPVSEWQVVLSKFAVALVFAPLVYVAISLLLQLSYVLLMMMLVWRMDQDPFQVVVANIDFMALMLEPISGWVMTALLIAPTYAWLLCASALARRSPFLMAVTPIVALAIGEGLFFGTERIGDAITRHFPHATDASTLGFYMFGPNWLQLDLLSAASGLLLAGLLLCVAVWLRKHRWELS